LVSVRGRAFARAGGRGLLECSVYLASTGVKSRVTNSLGSGACGFLLCVDIGGIGGLRFLFVVRLSMGCGGFAFLAACVRFAKAPTGISCSPI
jgi:hypothetical protein